MKDKKVIRSILLIAIFFSFFAILKTPDKTYSIYKEELPTTINLTITSGSDVAITFNSNGGNSIPSRTATPGQFIGTLPIPERSGYNFMGWLDSNNSRVTHTTIVTGAMNLTADWQKVVCKKVTTTANLHTETCLHGSGNSGCLKPNYYSANDTITYGTLTNDDYGPRPGDAYDCDIDNDGVYNPTDQYGKYTERFYYIRENATDDTAVLVFYTSYDEDGRVDSQHKAGGGGSHIYTDALSYIPKNSGNSSDPNNWDNPELVVFGTDNTARLLSVEDVEEACGASISSGANTSYFLNCQYILENSRFQSDGLGRAGIWLEYSNNYHRIQTQTVKLEVPDKGASSENTIRPVIEIPTSTLEGFVNETQFNISFDTHGGNTLDNIKRYRGQTIGNLPTPTRNGHNFLNWYLDSEYNTLADTTAIVEGNITLHAKWESTNTAVVTFVLNGGTGVPSTLTVGIGDTIDPWQVPTYEGKTFGGWFTDDETFTSEFTQSSTVTGNITLYAKWNTLSGVAAVNNVGYSTLADAIVAVPTGVKTVVTILQDIPLTATVTIPSNKNVELDIGSYTISNTTTSIFTNNGTLSIKNGIINGSKAPLITNSGTLNISGGTITSNGSTGAIKNNSGATVNISGGTLNSNNTAATDANILANSGTVIITGGTINGLSQAAAINNNSGGVLTMSGGKITSTHSNKAQAIYNNGGTLTISGSAQLENSSENRAAVHNNAGTVNILGGTIVAHNYSAVVNNATMTIGNSSDPIDITTPVMQGKTYGLEVNSGKTVAVYDGIFKSEDNSAINDTTRTSKPSNTRYAEGTEEIDEKTYNTAYLVVNTFTLTFNHNDGTGNTTVITVNPGSSIGTLPQGPTRANYMFDGWFTDNVDYTTEVKSIDVPIGDEQYYAKWTGNINAATISPNPLNLTVGQVYTIQLTSADEIENATFESNNTSVASVTNAGIVTALTEGTATITITGTRSTETRTVSVIVTQPKYQLTFNHNDGTGNTTEVEINQGATIGTLPQGPTRTNYMFDGWFTDNVNYTTEVLSSRQPSDDEQYFAKWTGNINIATISPSSLDLLTRQSSTISLTSTDPMETYTFTSNNPSVATVNNAGMVTGVSSGNTTITITGTRSNETKTVSVIVESTLACTVTFDNDGVTTDYTVPCDSSLGDDMPNNPVKSGYTFVGWFIDGDIDELFDKDTEVIDDITVVAEWTLESNVLRIGNTYYDNIQEAFDDVPSTDVETEIFVLKDFTVTQSIRPTIATGKNVKLIGKNYTVGCTNSTQSNLILIQGKLTVESGTFTCGKDKSATLELAPGASVDIKGGRIINTNNRSAIFNNAGTVRVFDGAYLSSVAPERAVIQNSSKNSSIIINGGTIEQLSASCKRGALENTSGATITVTGGTIVSKSTVANENASGIQNTNGTLVIGSINNRHSTTSPIIQAETYGVLSGSTGNDYSFYDGVIKGVTGAVDNPSKITNFESSFVPNESTEVIENTTYNVLYYVSGETYRINLAVNGGTIDSNYVTLRVGESINNASGLPTPTKGVYTFDGWYTDVDLEIPVTYPITASASGETTLYAKWSYAASNTPVNFNMVNDVMTVYFNNVASWQNDITSSTFTTSWQHEGISTYESHMLANFEYYNCSKCNGPNTCSSPQAGTYCERPKGYDTGISEAVNVYIYDLVNEEADDELVTYVTSDTGVIYNMIPGVTYYWEAVSDSNVHGIVTATGQRRTIYSPVRNLRDLGGMSVDSNGDGTPDGTLKYGILYRGAQNSSGQTGANSLTKLGITREIDLRADGDNNSGQTHLPNYDVDYSDNRFEYPEFQITGSPPITNPNDDETKGYKDIVITNYLINPIATNYLTTPHLDNYKAFKAALKQVMRQVVDGDSIYFHCTIGTDRTGTLAYFLEGLLGVPLEERLQDYELTYFFGLTNRHRYHDYLSGSSTNPRFESMYKSYPDYQSIYNFYKYIPESDDDQLLADFKSAMIDSN